VDHCQNQRLVLIISPIGRAEPEDAFLIAGGTATADEGEVDERRSTPKE